MKQLIDSLSKTDDGAFIIDKDHRITFWNQSAEKILGYKAEEALNKYCFEILGGLDDQGRTLCRRFCRFSAIARKDETFPNTDFYCHMQSGEGRWLNVTTFTSPNSGAAGDNLIVHLFRDITEKKDYQRFVDSVLAASEQLHKKNGHQIRRRAGENSQMGGLTDREQQVLALLANGLGTDEVASKLVVSPATVRNHVQNILTKMGVHSRLEAVALAYQNDLIDTDKK